MYIYIYIYIYIWSAIATNNLFFAQNLTTCFGPYGPSSGENVAVSCDCRPYIYIILYICIVSV
jgi:hypothetical protein